jgi:hypothetical protein
VQNCCVSHSRAPLRGSPNIPVGLGLVCCCYSIAWYGDNILRGLLSCKKYMIHLLLIFVVAYNYFIIVSANYYNYCTVIVLNSAVL